MVRFLTSPAVIVLLFVASSARADCYLTQKQTQIMQLVMTVGGYLNKEMHEEFWEDMRDRCGSDWLPWFLWIKNNLQLSQRYQLEVWKSALASFQAKMIVQTRRLGQLERVVEEHAAEAPFPTASEAEGYYIHHYRPVIDLMKANTAELLQAAAAHASIRIEGGYTIYFDREEVIRYIFYGMNEGFKRSQSLLNPAWKG